MRLQRPELSAFDVVVILLALLLGLAAMLQCATPARQHVPAPELADDERIAYRDAS